MATTPAQLVKNKPVAVVGTVAALAEGVTGYLVAKGYIPEQLSYVVTLALVAIAGAIIHALVSPFAKVKGIVEQGLHITDADYGRIEALVEQYGLRLVEKATPKPVEPAAPVTSPPDGMSAGAAPAGLTAQ